MFVKPAGGWSGVLNEQAKLTASDGNPVDWFGAAVAVDGETVVVGAQSNDTGSDPDADQGAAYVFVKPAGGWSGQLQEDAKLTASDVNPFEGNLGAFVAVDGDTVVTPASAAGLPSAYVFVKPAGGWGGQLQEQAKLNGPDLGYFTRVGISDDTVVLSVPFRLGAVFVKPAGGWSGQLGVQAELAASDGGDAGSADHGLAVDGDTVVASSFSGSYMFVKPAGGWSGVVNEQAKLTDDAVPITMTSPGLDGKTAVILKSDGAHVFSEAPISATPSPTPTELLLVLGLLGSAALVLQVSRKRGARRS